MNKKLLIAALVIMLLSVSFVSARYCNTNDVLGGLRKALYAYYVNPSGSGFTPAELKSLLSFYVGIQSGQITIDCTSQSNNIDKADGVADNIPICSDGTKYGKCSDNKPMYCYAGNIVPRCRLCGCSAGEWCDATYVYTEKGNKGRWGKCYSGTDVTCSIDSDCGNSGYVWDYFCQNGDVYKNYNRHICLSPGETNSSCLNETTAVLIDDCQGGEECVDGQGECQTLGEDCTSESLTVSFGVLSGATTTNQYTGSVRVSVQGSGQSSGIAYNDAFYVYTSYRDGNPITPKVQNPFLLYVDRQPVTDVTATPSYNSEHSYSFVFDAGTTPKNINFRIGDTYVPDNSGSFRIEVCGDVAETGDSAPPTVAITVAPTTVAAGEFFNVTVTGTDDTGLNMIWWWGTDTGDTELNKAHTYGCNSATYCTNSWLVSTNSLGTLTLGANSRDIVYADLLACSKGLPSCTCTEEDISQCPGYGEPHQASEGAGIAYATVTVANATSNCHVKIDGVTVKSVYATDRLDCYNKTSFGSINCNVHTPYFTEGTHFLEQYFGATDRVNNEYCTCQNGVCTQGTANQPDTLTIRGRWIGHFTQEPIPDAVVSTWNNQTRYTVYTDANGEFAMTVDTTGISTTEPKGFGSWPMCYDGQGFGLSRNPDDSLYANLQYFPLIDLSSPFPIQVVGSEVDLGTVPLWPAVTIKIFSDIPVKFGIDFSDKVGSGNINNKTSHTLSYSVPLNADVKIKLTDTGSNVYYSPTINLPLSHGCDTVTLNFFNGQFEWVGITTEETCSDGTSYGQCSTTKPKYCDNGTLVDNCEICGCDNGSCQSGSCVSGFYSECKLSNNVYHNTWIFNNPNSELDNVCKNDFGSQWEIFRDYNFGQDYASGGAQFLLNAMNSGGATNCYDDWSCNGPHGVNKRAYIMYNSYEGCTSECGGQILNIWGINSYLEGCVFYQYLYPPRNPYGCPYAVHTMAWGAYGPDPDHFRQNISGSNCGGTMWTNKDCNRDPNYNYMLCCH